MAGGEGMKGAPLCPLCARRGGGSGRRAEAWRGSGASSMQSEQGRSRLPQRRVAAATCCWCSGERVAARGLVSGRILARSGPRSPLPLRSRLDGGAHSVASSCCTHLVLKGRSCSCSPRQGRRRLQSAIARVALLPFLCAADLHVTTSAPPPSETSSNHLTGEHRCEMASDLSLVVSTECRTGQANDQCCGSLHAVMAGGGIVPCMCVLANTTAMTEARIGIRDLVDVYSACGHIRPGDLHFPSSGCEHNLKEVAPPAATPPPKLRPTWIPPPPQHSSSTPTVADIKEDEIEKLESILVSYNRLVVVIASGFALICVVLVGTAIYLFIAGQRRNRAQVHRQEDHGFEMPRINVQPRVIIPQEIQVNPPTAEDTESIVLNPPKKRKKHYELGIPSRCDPLAESALLKDSSSSSGSSLVY